MAIYKPRERTVTHPSLTASKRIKLCQYLNLGKIPPEKEMATHSSILSWELPQTSGVWRATVHGVIKSRT